MIELSVIVPTYNAEKTIINTLDSIYSLPIDPDVFEVIVVDDASEDSTIALLKQYASHHTNLIVRQQKENHRQGAARNVAIKMARGVYVAFVDSDDTVEVGMVNALTESLIHKPDVEICRYYRIDDNSEKKEISLINEPVTVVDGRTFMERHYDWFFVGAPWGYLFKNSFLNSISIPFAEDVFTEDVDWVMQHLYYADKIIVCKEPVYCYYHFNGSASNGGRDWFRTASLVLEAYRELVWAEKLQLSDKRIYEWITDVAQDKIEKQMNKIWKMDGRNFAAFYRKLNDYSVSGLLKKYKWSKATSFLLFHPGLSIFILSIVSGPMQLLKKMLG